MENNTNTNEATNDLTEKASKRWYQFVVGELDEFLGHTELDAKAEAVERYQKARDEKGLPRTRVWTHLIATDYEPATLPVPAGMTQREAVELLTWARQNMTLERIDWDKFELTFTEADEFESARHELGHVPVDALMQWLADGNGEAFDYVHQLTPDALYSAATTCAENYLGRGDRDEFVREYYEDSGALNSTPDEIIACVDWAEVWGYAMQYDVVEVETINETYFFNNY